MTTEELRTLAFTMTPAEQFRLASFIAENVGYVLMEEPPHPDSPHDDGVDPIGLEAASIRIYEDKGDRKGICYVGWSAEPEDVKAQWRDDVRVSIAAYLAATAQPTPAVME